MLSTLQREKTWLATKAAPVSLPYEWNALLKKFDGTFSTGRNNTCRPYTLI